MRAVSKTLRELNLQWKEDEPIKMYKDLRMPQFEIININDTTCQESFLIGGSQFWWGAKPHQKKIDIFFLQKCLYIEQKKNSKFKTVQIYMKDAEYAETNEKSIFRFLFFEI